MAIDRRGFLRLAGFASVAGLGTGKVIQAIADNALEGSYEPSAGALHGERWAMVVDIRKCKKEKGCTDCIDACHSVHNVPEFEDPKDEIKWIWRQKDFHSVFPEQNHEHVAEDLHHFEFPVLCNHCADPSCVRVCPTRTTWKRDDGVVMMDMHRCIGCRYCIAACPYGSRSFNWRDPRGADESGKPFIDEIDPDFPTRTRGVVEKCNFCAERLAKGLGPACVEACPAKALSFGDLEDANSKVSRLLKEHYGIRRKPGLGTDPQVYYLV